MFVFFGAPGVRTFAPDPCFFFDDDDFTSDCFAPELFGIAFVPLDCTGVTASAARTAARFDGAVLRFLLFGFLSFPPARRLLMVVGVRALTTSRVALENYSLVAAPPNHCLMKAPNARRRQKR